MTDFKITQDLLNEAKKYSNYEVINSGIHNFNLTEIRLTETDKTKKECIRYIGVIKNSKNEEQECVVNDLINTKDSFKFSFARLLKLYSDVFKKEFDMNPYNGDIEQIIKALSKELSATTFKLEFIKKQTKDGAIITEKVLSYK